MINFTAPWKYTKINDFLVENNTLTSKKENINLEKIAPQRYFNTYDVIIVGENHNEESCRRYMNYVATEHKDVLKTCTVLIEGPHTNQNLINNPGVLKDISMVNLLVSCGAQVSGIESENNGLSLLNNQLTLLNNMKMKYPDLDSKVAPKVEKYANKIIDKTVKYYETQKSYHTVNTQLLDNLVQDLKTIKSGSYTKETLSDITTAIASTHSKNAEDSTISTRGECNSSWVKEIQNQLTTNQKVIALVGSAHIHNEGQYTGMLNLLRDLKVKAAAIVFDQAGKMPDQLYGGIKDYSKVNSDALRDY